MVLLDRNFPDALAEKCKGSTREASATNAVRKTLERHFLLKEIWQKKEEESQRDKALLQELLKAIRLKNQAEKKIQELIEKISD